jgi:hypothetical protein
VRPKGKTCPSIRIHLESGDYTVGFVPFFENLKVLSIFCKKLKTFRQKDLGWTKKENNFSTKRTPLGGRRTTSFMDGLSQEKAFCPPKIILIFQKGQI